MMGDTFRCFVAVPVSDEVKAFFASFVDSVRDRYPGYRFGAAENLHITLQFLGDVPRNSSTALTESLASAVQDITEFRLGCEDAGGFPDRGTPRILHLSVTHGVDTLGRLAARVRNSLTALGHADSKPFTPHITLGRERNRQVFPRLGSGMTNIRSSWKDSYMEFLEMNRGCAEWDARKVLLVESVLQRQGPIYAPVARIGLKRAR